MKKKTSKVIILIIELLLIIFGLILSDMGAIRNMSMGLPGAAKPETEEGADMDIEAANRAEFDVSNPPESADVAPATEGEELPENDINMSRESGSTFSFAIVHIVPIIIYVLLLVYVLLEYAKPHGNMLRITMLAYAFMLAIWSAAQGTNAGCVYVIPCTAVIVAFISGRLNKIKQNIVWFAVAAAFLIGYGILQTVLIGGVSYGILQASYCFGALLQLITLALAYFSRYDEHKEAGLTAIPPEN